MRRFCVEVCACAVLCCAAPAANCDEPRAAVFSEPGFPSSDGAIPSPAWFCERIPGASTVDAAGLADHSFFNARNFSFLILPYGEAFPQERYADILGFIRDGGGIVTVSGRPFCAPMVRANGAWSAGSADPYEAFCVPAGIKYYRRERGWGVTVKTGKALNPVMPTRGNVFPYRIPARSCTQACELSQLFSGFNVLLVKCPRNPFAAGDSPAAKWCCIIDEGRGNPLNPSDPAASSRLMFIFRYLRYPLSIEQVEPSFASYRPGERLGYGVSLRRSGALDAPLPFVLEITILDAEGRKVAGMCHRGSIPAGKERMTVQGSWKIAGAPSFLRLRAVLLHEGEAMDKEENGVAVFDRKDLKSGPALGIRGGSFILDGKPAVLFGVNYYESSRGELMWLHPDMARVRDDFAAMRGAGMRYVRIHYHHSKWFRDYFLREGITPDAAYFSVADRAPIPGERSLRVLDAVVRLAQEQGLVLCLDLFSLVPSEMGDPRGWLGMAERVRDPGKIACQKRFARLLAARYRGVPGLTWDLWNEPRLAGEDRVLLKSWAREIIAELRAGGDTHPVTIGDDDSTDMLDVLDYGCVHARDLSAWSGRSFTKPVMCEELWNEAGSTPAEELRQARKLEDDLRCFAKSGLAGFAPWQWTGQARLWDVNRDERWDDELGMCVRDDGSEKPAGRRYRELIGRYSGQDGFKRRDAP